MLKIFRIHISICIILLLGHSNISCKKDAVPLTYTYNGYFKGKVDGLAFNYTTNLFFGKDCPNSCSLNTIRVSFREGSFQLWCPIEVGQYIFSDTKFYSASVWYGNDERYLAGIPPYQGYSPYYYGPGQIAIVESSENYIKGTFEFVGKDGPLFIHTKTITEGEFYISRS